MSDSTLRSVLLAYETGGVAALQRLLEATPPTDARFESLVAGLGEDSPSVPLTWLLRAWLKRGFEPREEAVAAYLRVFPDLEAKEARLHACQSIVHLEVPAESADALAEFLRDAVKSDHKFTRAWAVDGFHRLGLQHAEYRGEARRIVDRASRDGAASVRARVRQIVAE